MFPFLSFSDNQSNRGERKSRCSFNLHFPDGWRLWVLFWMYSFYILSSHSVLQSWWGGPKKIQTQTAWKCCNFSSLQGICLGPVKNGDHGPGRLSKAGIIEQEEKFPVPNEDCSAGCQWGYFFRGFSRLGWALIDCVYMQNRWKIRIKMSGWLKSGLQLGRVRLGSLLCPLLLWGCQGSWGDKKRKIVYTSFLILWSQLGAVLCPSTVMWSYGPAVLLLGEHPKDSQATIC